MSTCATRVILVLAGLAAITTLAGCAPPAPGTTAASIDRALWITRWDYLTAEEVRTAIDRAASGGFDTVFFQVRGNATAFYASPLEPWAEEFGFADPGFDPLEVACARAAERGVALHAWVNAIPGWRGESPPADSEQLYHTRPDWFLYDGAGEREPLKKDYYVALNPCHPEVRAHIAAVCGDIAARYPVAGIHLDYIRFLESAPEQDYPHDPVTHWEYQRDVGGEPGTDSEAWDRWRRDQVTRLVREIDAAIEAEDPGVQLTAAVFRTPMVALRFQQDWVRWLRNGWIDAAVPMVYHDDDALFESQVAACVSAAGGRPVVIGIGTFKHDDPAQTARQVDLARRQGAVGICHFGYASFFEAGPAGAQGATPALREARRARLFESR